MTTIKCRKCGKVYPFDDKICPVCGYDIREDETLSGRDRMALGKESGLKITKIGKFSEEEMEHWKSQTKEERQQENWENRNTFGFMPNDGGQPRLNIPAKTMMLLTVIMVVFVCLIKMIY